MEQDIRKGLEAIAAGLVCVGAGSARSSGGNLNRDTKADYRNLFRDVLSDLDKRREKEKK